jgi:hypothetical protein
MLIQVHMALEELGLEPVWREHGVICTFSVPRNGRTYLVRRMFFVDRGHLMETASLYDGPAEMNRVEPQPLARHAAVYDPPIGDVTPPFVGRLLDNSTTALLDWAGEPSVVTSAKT